MTEIQQKQPNDYEGVLKVIRVGVTGGRDFFDKKFIYLSLNKLLFLLKETNRRMVLVHGCAKGADSLADEWAKEFNVEIDPYPVTPEQWKELGKKAGVIRNQKMVDSGLHFLCAFPGNDGTLDMIKRCKKAGIEIWEPKIPQKI